MSAHLAWFLRDSVTARLVRRQRWSLAFAACVLVVALGVLP